MDREPAVIDPPSGKRAAINRPDAMQHAGDPHRVIPDAQVAPAADHDEVDLNVAKPPVAWVIGLGIVTLVLAGILLVIGIVPRWHTNQELGASADAALHAPIPVNAVHARRSSSVVSVAIPGTLRPWQEVSLYSRSTGYLTDFFVDISNQVTKGQKMAVISTPEVDQQLISAQATYNLQVASLQKAQTDLQFADITNNRFRQLIGTKGVTQLELDQYQNNLNVAKAAYEQAKAQVDVAKASVDQLKAVKSFEEITAPFAGVVTGRAFDRGSFIIANPTTADISPLFKLAENDILRAFVNVPQDYALLVKKGMTVVVHARERPGRDYTGTVLGTTNYLDPSARSLLTEIRIENPDLSLLPGMYIEASFKMTRDNAPLIIPAPALVINADGNQVGVIRDGKVHFEKVTLGVDFGNEIEVVTGLSGDETILGNPGEKTVEGAAVKIAAEEPAPPAPPVAAGSPAADKPKVAQAK